MLIEVIMPFSWEMRVFIIKCYFKIKSYKTSRESFKEKFVDEQTLPNSTIKRIVQHFEVLFRLEDVPCSRRPTMRTYERREEVRQQIVATRCILVHKLVQCVPTLSCMSVYHTLKDLCLHPYYIRTNETRVKTDRPSKMSKFLQLVFEIYTPQNKCTLQPFFHQ